MPENEYPGLNENLERFKNDLVNEKAELLFKIAYKQGYEAGQYETIVIGTAADEWQKGEPKESGRYLVEYEQGERVKKVFVMDYDAFEGRWLTHSTEAEVLRWAKINSEYQ